MCPVVTPLLLTNDTHDSDSQTISHDTRTITQDMRTITYLLKFHDTNDNETQTNDSTAFNTQNQKNDL